MDRPAFHPRLSVLAGLCQSNTKTDGRGSEFNPDRSQFESLKPCPSIPQASRCPGGNFSLVRVAAIAVVALVPLVQLSNLESLRADGEGRCVKQKATLVGTVGNNVLRGTPHRDVIAGRAGDDVILGLEGADIICGGRGDDRLKGGTGDDWLGGQADTRLTGDSGSDRLIGGGGDDEIFEGRGHDLIKGGPGNDRLYAGAGKDRLWGGRDLDSVIFSLAPNGVRVDLRRGRSIGWGRDRLSGLGEVRGSDFADRLFGGAGGQVLDGNAGRDRISAGRGRDTLLGGRGDDILSGGDGEDYVAYIGSSRSVRVDLGKGLALGEGADKLSATESVFGTVKDDRLVGDAGSNTLIGGLLDGGDVLKGRGGPDTFYRLVGDSRLDGGGGSDIGIYDDFSIADLNGGTISGPEINDAVSRLENVRCDCSDETTILGSEARNVLIGGEATDRITGLEGNDRLFGRQGNDLLDGGPDEDKLTGGIGQDVCTSGERTRSCEGPSKGRVSAAGSRLTLSEGQRYHWGAVMWEWSSSLRALLSQPKPLISVSLKNS